ncbi:MAG: sialate O-acetylesterase, partial [Planctomycetota bacterium]
MILTLRRLALLVVLGLPWASSAPALGAVQKGPLKVFILAGQSNMQGHAKASTLAALRDDPATEALHAALVDEDGEPRVFEDVRITSIGSSESEKAGPLSVGYGAERGGPKFGPEFSFGAAVSRDLGEPVLLIKTAWGGKSLHTDFRPPSAGPFVFSEAQIARLAKNGKDVAAVKAAKVEATGRYYRMMMEHVESVLADIERVVPGHDRQRGHELAGFVWFQGWNDMVASDVYPDRARAGGYDAYTEVLCHFIRDVRTELGTPELPFVIGVMGVGGPTDLYGPKEQRYRSTHQNFRDAMAAPASLEEFEGSVQAVLTEEAWDSEAAKLLERKKAGEELTAEELAYLDGNVSNAAYHYLGSPKVLGRVGAALAEGWKRARAQKAASKPAWIWLEETEGQQEVIFRRRFELAEAPSKAVLAGSCDNHMIVLVNGERAGRHGRWEVVVARDVASMLVAGENVIEVRARNEGGPAGLALKLAIDGGPTLVTDESWEAALAQRARRGRFGKASALGMVGDDSLPWSDTVTLASFDAPAGELTAVDPGLPQVARNAEAIHVPDGFRAELLYNVPNELHGSWVSLAKDDRGRLYASDQGGRGIYRVTPAPLGDPDAVTVVEPVEVDISGAQGMLWAFYSLYVNVYGKGLFRLRDTDGDDALDTSEHLVPLGSGGEHGPHAIHLTEDGEGLYFIGGNHVRPPEYQSSRAPDNWDEDLLLKRLWDAGGHARGIMAPGGWIARCDPDGKNIDIVSSGYRNQYDIALNPEGEMFTYDADMEWD